MELVTLGLVGVGLALLGSRSSSSTPKVSSVWAYVAGKPTLMFVTAIGVDAKGKTLWLRGDAANAWASMKAAAAAVDVELIATEAFRTFDEQLGFYEKYLAGTGYPAAAPGYSKHQEGLAVDVETAMGTNDAFDWLTFHAERFGFRRTVASEPWHWEFA